MSVVTISGMDHVNIWVTDIHKSLKFYGQVFGFEIKESYLENEKPGAIIGIKNIAYIAMYQVDALPEMARMSHFGLVLSDPTTFGDIVKKLKAIGIKTEVIEWPKSKSIYIYDPDGHEIELSTHFGGNLG